MVRAAQNRRLEDAPGKLFELPEVLATAGSHTLDVMQKGGRAALQARMFISYSEVSIKSPDNSGQGKRLVRTVLIFTESSDQLSRATDRVPGLPASPGYVQ